VEELPKAKSRNRGEGGGKREAWGRDLKSYRFYWAPWVKQKAFKNEEKQAGAGFTRKRKVLENHHLWGDYRDATKGSGERLIEPAREKGVHG